MKCAIVLVLYFDLDHETVLVFVCVNIYPCFYCFRIWFNFAVFRPKAGFWICRPPSALEPCLRKVVQTGTP